MPLYFFDRSRLPAAPWKNGGGVTREIVSNPRRSGLESFVWRASIADVSANGPFSNFAGVDRVIVLLEGNGVLLRDADGRLVRRLDEPFAPFTFSGDDHLAASLVRGPSSDFNVMTRRGVAAADVRAIRSTVTLPASPAGVLFAARGRWTVRSIAPAGAPGVPDKAESSLEAGGGCWWEDEPLAWEVIASSSDDVLLAVGIFDTR